jgi:hypothetical protein
VGLIIERRAKDSVLRRRRREMRDVINIVCSPVDVEGILGSRDRVLKAVEFARHVANDVVFEYSDTSFSTPLKASNTHVSCLYG